MKTKGKRIIVNLLAAVLVVTALIPHISIFTNDPEIPYVPPVVDPEPEPDPVIDPDPPEVEEEIVIYPVSPVMSELFTLVNREIQEFLKDYYRGIGQKYYHYLTDHFTGNETVHFEWISNKDPQFSVMYLSLNSDMKDADEYVCQENQIDLYNLQTGTDYYWQVCSVYEGYAVKSDVYSFHTADTPRIVIIDGISNTRDLGGYQTESGVHLNQGMIYRTATADGTTDLGRMEADIDLHIKTELDLRDAGESGARLEKSPLGENVRYVNVPGVLYTNILKEENWETARNTFKLFADRNNYPILLHCQAGRDRTGTVSIILLGLCGVPEETIYKEYELSFFSKAGTEMNEDGKEVEILLGYVNNMMKNLKKFGDENSTLAGCCRNYLLKVGLSMEEIETIRLIMTGNAGIKLPHKKVDVVIPEIRTYD